MLYAKVVSGAITEYRTYESLDPAAIRIVDGLPMLRPVTDTKPTFDPVTQVREGPVITINPADVQRVWTVRSKTAQELDNEKTAEVDGQNRVLLRVILDHENRIRALEGKAAITMNQLKNALKGML